jgi:Ca-activated chloride channel family protein
MIWHDALPLAFGDWLLLRPLWLLALLPLGYLVWRLARARDDAAAGWESVVDAGLLRHLAAPGHERRHRRALVLLGTALCITVLALCGPALPGKSDLAFRSDATRVLVVDLSTALPAGDAAAPVLERLRLKLLTLLRTMPPGQTALVVYAEEPYLVAPLTTDAETLALLVPELAPQALPLAGERPERALRMAGDLLLRSGGSARDVLWFAATDAPTPAALQVADDFRTHGMRLSVMQLGSTGMPPAASLVRLQDIARTSGGLYLAPAPDDSDTRQLATLFASATGTIRDGARATATPRDFGPWLLPLLLPLAALAFRRGVLILFALPLLLQPPPALAGDTSAWWSRPDTRAMALLQTGQADAAARHFTDPRWQAVAHYRAGQFAAAATALAPFSDPDSLYNRGTALARLDRLPEAQEALQAALAVRPDDADIRHNLNVVRELLDRKGSPPPESEGAPDTQEAPPPPPPAESGDATRPPGQTTPPGDSTDSRPTPEPGTDTPHDGSANDAVNEGGPGGDAAPHNTSPAAPEPPADGGNASTQALPRGRSDPEREADLLAEQLMRRVPDEPAGLLQRKLLLEHQRRERGEAPRRWQ